MTKKGSESRSIKDSLSSLFKFNQDMFLGNTQTILQINSVLIPLAENYVSYLQQQDWKSIKNMPYESLKQYFNLANVLFEQQRVIKGITDDTAKAAYEKLQHRVATALLLPKFIREMSFVYLVAKFEDFISKELQIVFTRIPKSLKTKGKTVSYEELFGASNLDELTDKLIEYEIIKIMMKNIEDMNKDLISFLEFDLKHNIDNWKAIRECFQRRHIILHNNGKVNTTYRQKTGKNPVEEHLSVDERYLSKSIILFETYCNEITNRVLQKFAKEKT